MNSPQTIPERFKVRTGGIYGPAYSVRIKDGELLYRIYDDDEYQETKIYPTGDDWRNFKQALDEIGVWQWRAEYPGTGEAGLNQWFLEIEWGGKKIKSSGDDNFPMADGNPENTADISPTFEKLLGAVRKLIGGLEFS